MLITRSVRVILLFGFCVGCITIYAQHDHGAPDQPSVHGMVIFGSDRIYASHLPLFRAPHDYQIILELEFEEDAKKQFLDDQKQHPEFNTYTLEPERFILPEKIKNPTPFNANMYRGHFERGGYLVISLVKVKIKKVVYFKQFNPEEKKLERTDYILVGDQQNQFAVHIISQRPDVDQIVSISLARWEEAWNGVIVTTNASYNEPQGVSGNQTEILLPGSVKQKVTWNKQLYMEWDDLR